MPGATIRVRLTPRSSANRLVRLEDGVLHVRVAAPPVEGAANKALLSVLAEALNVPRSALTLKSGAASREKVVVAEPLDAGETLKRLERALAGGGAA